MTLAHGQISPERWAVAAIMVALAAPLLALAGTALGVPLGAGVLVALMAAVLACAGVAYRLPPALDGLRRTHPVWCALWLLVGLAAVVRTAGVAWFMADPEHAQSSAFWFDEFYIRHNCASAYWQAAQLARQGVDNLYDTAHYTGFVGRFKVDEFMYLPQFLLLPQIGIALGGDFLALRAAWFAIEAGLVGAAMLALCHWIGGPVGRRAALLLPAVWVASPVLLTLQVGNFQLAAIAMSVLAMMLFERDRPVLGGALLGFAVFKLFPGLLGIYLLATRRWRAAAWTLAFSLLYTGILFVWFGWKPFDAFLHYQLPRILSGEAWAFLEFDGLEVVNAINHSIPGLVLKLKVLGVDGMSRGIGGGFAWLWTAIVVAMAVLTAQRSPAMSRSERAAAWLALIALAAFRSPFLPDHNGLFAPLWLWSLVAASTRANTRNVIWLAIGLIALSAVLPFGSIPAPDLLGVFAVSTASQLIGVGLCLWVVLRRPSPRGADERRDTQSDADANAPLAAVAVVASFNAFSLSSKADS